jgi:hypothetical protein
MPYQYAFNKNAPQKCGVSLYFGDVEYARRGYGDNSAKSVIQVKTFFHKIIEKPVASVFNM